MVEVQPQDQRPALSPEEAESMAEEYKNKGNDLFKANDINGAINCYSEAISKCILKLKFASFVEE